MTDQEVNEAVATKLGWQKNHPIYPSTVPDYCHDIAAAWKVLLSPRLAWELKRDAKGTFTLKMGTFINSDLSTSYMITIETELHKLPEAICRAFLFAKAPIDPSSSSG